MAPARRFDAKATATGKYRLVSRDEDIQVKLPRNRRRAQVSARPDRARLLPPEDSATALITRAVVTYVAVSCLVAGALAAQVKAQLKAPDLRPRCACDLPEGRPGDLYCCACREWWMVKEGKQFWQPVSRRRLERPLIAQLRQDIERYERTGKWTAH